MNPYEVDELLRQLAPYDELWELYDAIRKQRDNDRRDNWKKFKRLYGKPDPMYRMLGVRGVK